MEKDFTETIEQAAIIILHNRTLQTVFWDIHNKETTDNHGMMNYKKWHQQEKKLQKIKWGSSIWLIRKLRKLSSLVEEVNMNFWDIPLTIKEKDTILMSMVVLVKIEITSNPVRLWENTLEKNKIVLYTENIMLQMQI